MKKQIKKHSRLYLLVIILTITMLLPNNIVNAKSTTTKTPTISKTSLNLNIGTKYTIKLNGVNQTLSWKTSNSKIATVDNSGKITAKTKGNATIYVVYKNKKYQCKVTVKKVSISISNTSLKLIEKEYKTIKLNGITKKLPWKTSNSKIATVNSSGKIIAKKEGEVTIYVTYAGKKYKCLVTVKGQSPVKVTDIKWTNGGATIYGSSDIYFYRQYTGTKPVKRIDITVIYYNTKGKLAQLVWKKNPDVMGWDGKIFKVLKDRIQQVHYGFSSQLSKIKVSDIVISYADGSKQYIAYNKTWHYKK